MRLLNPLFALLGAATDPQLARMVEFLKLENRILRDKLPKRITVTKQERTRLIKLGEGSAMPSRISSGSCLQAVALDNRTVSVYNWIHEP